jgi:hypothetical protein
MSPPKPAIIRAAPASLPFSILLHHAIDQSITIKYYSNYRMFLICNHRLNLTETKG